MKTAFLFKATWLIVSLLVFPAFKSGWHQQEPLSLKAYNNAVKDKVVLVYFSASWCNVCGKFKPVIAQIERDYTGKVIVLRINTEKDKEVAEEFEVNSLPLLILYKNGKKVWENTGIIEIASLQREIDCYLD